MIRLALLHELNALCRTPSRVAAVLAFLVAGFYAISAGESFTEEWHASIDEVEEDRSARIEEVRSFLKAGLLGPSSQPWVDLRIPAWQDAYAMSRVARLPAPLAGIAFGAVDNAPVVVSINRRTDPFLAEGVRIENPEHGSSGDLDLSFVLVYLLPLLIAVLGIEVGGYERDRGLIPLLAVQTGRPWRWLLTRVAVVTGVAGACALLLTSTAGATGGAGGGEWFDLTAITAAYTIFWGAVLAFVLSFRGGVSANALGMGLAWVLVCILGPTLAAERALSRTAGDYGQDLSLEARAQRYEMVEQDQQALRAELYHAYPALQLLPYATATLPDRMNERHIMEAVMFANLRARHDARVEREAEQMATLTASLWLSPAIATAHALERLAGVGHESATAFRARVVEATDARVNWVLERAWKQQRLALADFDELLESAPEAEVQEAGALGGHLGALALWAALLIALAGFRMRSGVGR